MPSDRTTRLKRVALASLVPVVAPADALAADPGVLAKELGADAAVTEAAPKTVAAATPVAEYVPAEPTTLPAASGDVVATKPVAAAQTLAARADETASTARSLASAEVRLAHGVPGVDQGELSVKGEDGRQSAGFGEVTGYRKVDPGSATFELRPKGGDVAATKTARLKDGARYTVAAMNPGKKVDLAVYRDKRAVPGQALVRVIHAAPELGSPDVAVDGKVVARSFDYMVASPYLRLAAAPAAHVLAALMPGTTRAVLEVAGVKLASGTTSTAFVFGTKGEKIRAVLVRDDKAAAPKPKREGNAGGRSVRVVKPGESLWSIAREIAGPGADDRAVAAEMVRLWNRNKGRVASGDPDVILPGLRLQLA